MSRAPLDVTIRFEKPRPLPMDVRTDSNFIRTATGRRFWPTAPQAADVSIHDIAHALSHLCRFTGHTRDFYCVAQHSVLVLEQVELRTSSREARRLALLHDASEAYLNDLARPLKYAPGLSGYRHAEALVEQAILDAFGLHPSDDDIAVVKLCDNALLCAEFRDVVPFGTFGGAASSVRTIYPVPPAEARQAFLLAFYRLFTNGDAQ